ncbi:MAG: hypothetical protein GY915_00460 [bacterium]|nr:hypothetical protein [bacterium]
MLEKIQNLVTIFKNGWRFTTRPLVWVLFVCALLVSVKVTSIGKTLSEFSQTEVKISFEPSAVHAAQEQTKEESEGTTSKQEGENKSKAVEKEDPKKIEKEENKEKVSQDGREGKTVAEKEAEIFDPFSLSATEIDTLQALVKRRKEIEKRSWALDAREVVLQALEKRISVELVALKAVQKNVLAIYNKLDQRDDKTTQRLVKMYETMKPKEAAKILEALNESVLLELMENMKESSGSAILAKMTPMRAQKLTYQLAQRRDVLDQPTENQLADGLAGDAKKAS